MIIKETIHGLKSSAELRIECDAAGRWTWVVETPNFYTLIKPGKAYSLKKLAVTRELAVRLYHPTKVLKWPDHHVSYDAARKQALVHLVSYLNVRLQDKSELTRIEPWLRDDAHALLAAARAGIKQRRLALA